MPTPAVCCIANASDSVGDRIGSLAEAADTAPGLNPGLLRRLADILDTVDVETVRRFGGYYLRVSPTNNHTLPVVLRSLAAAVAVLLFATACSASSAETGATTPDPDVSTTSSATSSPSALDAQVPIASSATLHTNKGNINVTLFADEAPNTVRNFAGLATGQIEWQDPKTGETSNEPLYDGTIFHRVIPEFMIQGGDPLGTGAGGPGYQFADEINPDRAFDEPYLLAMANSGPNTTGSQFFITVEPTEWLNFNHTIFGEVTDKASRKVVDSIEAVPTGAQDRPEEDVVIKSITVEEG
jgi:peptidyl-prolyl cis-trans isomerase A (cyclophilin A)